MRDSLEKMEQKKKSVVTAYLLWLFGGIFGLHLFYLERDVHAFLTWSTLGGYGLGWLADITKIPRYVKDCNEDPRYMEELIAKIRLNKKPPYSISRFISALTVGYLWGQLVMLATPEEVVAGIDWGFTHWLIPLAVALGVWVVGNIGREQGTPWATIAVSYLSYASRWYFYDVSTWLNIVTFCAASAFNYFSKEWRRTPKKPKSKLRRLSTLIVCAMLYISLWSSYCYFNGKITDANGDEIPIHEAIHHFFTSPWWTDLKQSLFDIYQYAQHHGWYEVWKQIIELSDPQGEQNSYKILGLGPTASQTEITAKWRSLSKEWHPDKVKDPDQKRVAQEKFMEIQQAYEILSNIKNKRKRKNRKSINDDE